MSTNRSKPTSAPSPKPEPSFTADDLAAALAEALRQSTQAEGASASDIEAVTGWHREKVIKAIHRAIAAKMLVCKGRQYRMAIDGAQRPVPVYGLIDAR